MRTFRLTMRVGILLALVCYTTTFLHVGSFVVAGGGGEHDTKGQGTLEEAQENLTHDAHENGRSVCRNGDIVVSRDFSVEGGHKSKERRVNTGAPDDLIDAPRTAATLGGEAVGEAPCAYRHEASVAGMEPPHEDEPESGDVVIGTISPREGAQDRRSVVTGLPIVDVVREMGSTVPITKQRNRDKTLGPTRISSLGDSLARQAAEAIGLDMGGMSGPLILLLAGSAVGAFSSAVFCVGRLVARRVYTTIHIRDPVQVRWVTRWLANYLDVTSVASLELQLNTTGLGEAASNVMRRNHGGRRNGHFGGRGPPMEVDANLVVSDDKRNAEPLWLLPNGATAVTVRLKSGRWARIGFEKQTAADSAALALLQTGRSGMNTRAVVITVLGRNVDAAVDLLKEAYELHMDGLKTQTNILRSQVLGGPGSPGHVDWMAAQSRPSRPLSTVVLNDDAGARLVRDVKDFFDAERWYADRGVPYRRGYLLYGPPGTGKTSFVTALAGELHVPIAVLGLADAGLSDSGLVCLLEKAPKRSIVLLEDVDAAFGSSLQRDATSGDHDELPSHESAADPETATGVATAAASGPTLDRGRRRPRGRESAGSSHRRTRGVTDGTSRSAHADQSLVTFSGLLNALDGVNAQEGKVLIMTTNHREKLDAALVRPGRVDVQVEFRRATSDAARRLFEKFFAEDAPSGEIAAAETTTIKTGDGGKFPAQRAASGNVRRLAIEFGDAIDDYAYSMAELVGHCMRYKASAENAVRRVSELVPSLAV